MTACICGRAETSSRRKRATRAAVAAGATMQIQVWKLVIAAAVVLLPAIGAAQSASPVGTMLRRDWSRAILRARPGETFASDTDCGTAVDRGARVLDRLGRFAHAYVTGHAVAPIAPLPPSSDGSSYRARCGRMRVSNPRSLDAATDLDARQDRIDGNGRSNAATGVPLGVRGTTGRVGTGGAAIVGLGALIFGSNRAHPDTRARRGVVRWAVEPFMLGGGVGLTTIGYMF